MFDSLFQDETNRSLQAEALLPREKPRTEPGLFTGTLGAIDRGLMQGSLEAGRFAVNAAVSAYRIADARWNDKTILDEVTKGETELGKRLGAAAAKWEPDPNTVGKAAQIVQGLTKVLGKAAAYVAMAGPAAGIAALSADEGINEGMRLTDKGVDAGTAATIGGLRAATTAAGAVLPVAGATPLATAGLVVASGPAMFMAEQSTVRDILSSQGYDQLAAEVDPYDVTSNLVALGLPGAMGVAAHAMRAKPAVKTPDGAPFRPTADEVDAARVALLDQHDVELVTGLATHEGRTPKPEDLVVHEQGMRDAVERADADPPPVRPIDTVGKDEPLPKHEAPAQQAVAPEPPAAAEIPRSKGLRDEQKAVETRFANQLAADPVAAMRAYDALPEAQGGRVLNTDIARELSPDYLANPTLHSASVHEPASWLMQKKFDEALAATDEFQQVTFLAGGGGSGKGSATSLMGDVFARSTSVVDTTLSKLSSAQKKVEATLAAGKTAQIIMVLRDPIDAMVNGVVPRGIRTGRIVPLKAFIDAHTGAAQTVKALAEQYKDDPRVQVRVVDNRGGPGEAKVADLAALDSVDYNDIEGRVLQELTKAHEAGKIPDSIFEAITGKPAQGSQGGGGLDGGADRSVAQQGGAEQGRQGQVGQGAGAPEPPEISLAREQIAARDFDFTLEDGTTIKASEALARIEAEAARMEQDAPAFEAAVNCLLGG